MPWLGEGPQRLWLCTCQPASVWLSAEDTCVHVHARPGPAPAARAPPSPWRSCRLGKEGRGGAGRPRPCSPEWWPGQGGRPGPGQRAGGGRGGLWSAPRASCPASGRDFGRKVGPIRKALPGEVGLPEAESASPGVHANPLPLPPPGASSTAAVPGLAPEAGLVKREHPASALGPKHGTLGPAGAARPSRRPPAPPG